MMLKYNLTNRGLFSEINNLINGYFFALQKGHSFRVSASASSLYFREDFEQFFKPIRLGEECEDVMEVGGLADRGKRGFGKIRSFARNHLGFEAKKLLLNDILLVQAPIKSAITSIIEELNLPDKFCALHVRRGDKVGERLSWTTKSGNHEAQRFEASDYLRLVPKNSHVFVLTDDSRAVEEIRLTISKLCHGGQVHTLATASQIGHSTKERLKANDYFSREEVISILAECEIASRSETFVGTMSSNLSNFITLKHRKPDQCISLDRKWRSI